mmetsp:Transcript_17316/g.42294  ORF Transcript_17316/g.42294 Transcript_17316/m.42294 type:complete len:297 (+) Transcript_17316:571-1461(+)
MVGSDDIRQLPSFVALVSNHSSFGESLVIFVRQVEVFESLSRVLFVHELDVDLSLQVIDKTNTSTSVTGNVNTWKFGFTSILGSLVEELIFLNSERSTLNSDIVGNQDNFTSLGVFRSLHVQQPSEHTNLVGTDLARTKNKFAIVSFEEFLSFENMNRDFIGLPVITDKLLPFADQTNFQQSKEVVCVRGANTTGNGTLSLDNVASSIRINQAEVSLASVGINNAVFSSNTGDRIRSLNVDRRLEPLALNRRRDNTERLSGGFTGLQAHSDFNFINTQLEQTISKLTLQLTNDLLE